MKWPFPPSSLCGSLSSPILIYGFCVCLVLYIIFFLFVLAFLFSCSLGLKNSRTTVILLISHIGASPKYLKMTASLTVDERLWPLRHPASWTREGQGPLSIPPKKQQLLRSLLQLPNSVLPCCWAILLFLLPAFHFAPTQTQAMQSFSTCAFFFFFFPPFLPLTPYRSEAMSRFRLLVSTTMYIIKNRC